MASVPTKTPKGGAGTMRGMALALMAGAILGVLSRLGDHLLSDAFKDLADVGGLWLVTAFAVGATVSTAGQGAITGTLTLLTAVSTYYLSTYMLDEPITGARTIPRLGFVGPWIVAALVGGPIFGGAGFLWRTWQGWLRVVAVALVSGFLTAESVLWLLRGTSMMSVSGAELVCAAVLPWLMLRPGERLMAVGLASGFGLVALATFSTVVALLGP